MIINLDEIDSTNEYLKRMSNDGYNSDEMLVVTAQYQTAGKGKGQVLRTVGKTRGSHQGFGRYGL